MANNPSNAAPHQTPAVQRIRKFLGRLLISICSHWSFEVVVFILAFAVVVLRTNTIQDSLAHLVPVGLGVAIFWICVSAWVVSFAARKRAESKVSASNRDEARKLATTVAGVRDSAGELKTRVEGIGNTAASFDRKLADAASAVEKVLSAVETLPHATFRKAWMRRRRSISAK